MHWTLDSEKGQGLRRQSVESLCLRGGATMTSATALSEEIPAADPWLWPQRVALGSLTLLVGDPGIGKSYLTHGYGGPRLARRLWPEEELAANSAAPQQAPAARVPGSTFLLCAEDDYPNTIRPRLVALGADLTKIIALRDDHGHQAFDLLPYLPNVRESDRVHTESPAVGHRSDQLLLGQSQGEPRSQRPRTAQSAG